MVGFLSFGLKRIISFLVNFEFELEVGQYRRKGVSTFASVLGSDFRCFGGLEWVEASPVESRGGRVLRDTGGMREEESRVEPESRNTELLSCDSSSVAPALLIFVSESQCGIHLASCFSLKRKLSAVMKLGSLPIN